MLTCQIYTNTHHLPCRGVKQQPDKLTTFTKTTTFDDLYHKTYNKINYDIVIFLPKSTYKTTVHEYYNIHVHVYVAIHSLLQ
jgi:hypothetical protein